MPIIPCYQYAYHAMLPVCLLCYVTGKPIMPCYWYVCISCHVTSMPIIPCYLYAYHTMLPVCLSYHVTNMPIIPCYQYAYHAMLPVCLSCHVTCVYIAAHHELVLMPSGNEITKKLSESVVITCSLSVTNTTAALEWWDKDGSQIVTKSGRSVMNTAYCVCTLYQVGYFGFKTDLFHIYGFKCPALLIMCCYFVVI